jgi:peptide/nickel transport system ATP-binding protein
VIAVLNGERTMQAMLSVRGLKAYYQTRHFGVERDVRAVDGIDFEVRRNEIYGLAGESSSGKTTLIKTIAAAWKPPLRIVAGAVSFAFAPDVLHMGAEDLARVRWKHLAYIVQGSMSVLNPVRRIRESFVDFAFRHLGVPEARPRHRPRLSARTVGRHAPARDDCTGHDLPTRVRDRRRADHRARRVGAERRARDGSRCAARAGLVGAAGHARSRRARARGRPHGNHVCGPLGRRGADELFKRPRHPYTAHLIASLPRIGDSAPRKPLEGNPPNLAAPPSGCRFHPRCPLAMERCRVETPAMQTIGTDHRVACFAVTP